VPAAVCTTVANGMATAADWMSAASFISMAGLLAFKGYDASVYLRVDRRLCAAGTAARALPAQVRQVTVPEFIGDRYYSRPPVWWP